MWCRFCSLLVRWYLDFGANCSSFLQCRCSIDFAAIPDKIARSKMANNHGRGEIMRGRVLDPPLLELGTP
jgi:hypothetical protein